MPGPPPVVVAGRLPAGDRLRSPEPPELSVVVPLLDEAATLPELYRRIAQALAGERFEMVFVNDGSTDGTGDALDLLAGDPRVTVVHLSRSFGHQPAVTAGLDHARGAAVVVMDGDLQDPPEAIPKLVEAWRAGADVVYGVRTNRKESLPKRAAYAGFYRLLRAVSEFDIPLDSGDFGLMSRRVVDALARCPERGRFVRGLRAYAGFRQVGVPVERAGRHAGRSKYTLRKLVSLAADGLIGFSAAPLRLVGWAGGLLLLAAAGVGVAAAWRASGWLGVAGVVLFAAGAQLVALGVVGAYIQRIFWEVKGRPAYIVREMRGPMATVRRAA